MLLQSFKKAAGCLLQHRRTPINNSYRGRECVCMEVMADSGGQPKQEQETLHSTDCVKTTTSDGFCSSFRHF